MNDNANNTWIPIGVALERALAEIVAGWALPDEPMPPRPGNDNSTSGEDAA